MRRGPWLFLALIAVAGATWLWSPATPSVRRQVAGSHARTRFAPSRTVGAPLASTLPSAAPSAVTSELAAEVTEQSASATTGFTLADYALIRQIVHNGTPETQEAASFPPAPERLPDLVAAHPELGDLPPICVSSLPGINLLPPANDSDGRPAGESAADGSAMEENSPVSLEPAAPVLPPLAPDAVPHNPHANA
jgi:hypothetical protein